MSRKYSSYGAVLATTMVIHDKLPLRGTFLLKYVPVIILNENGISINRNGVEMITVRHGDGQTKYGPGVSIDMDGDDIARAISSYLVAHDINISGPRTITVNGELCRYGEVYVDPCGFVITGGKKISGRGA